MTFVQLKDGENFAIDPTIIKKISPYSDGGTTIITHDGDNIYCEYDFKHVLTLINNALEGREQRTITNHKFPSCARG